jgi:hypothetical protein
MPMSDSLSDCDSVQAMTAMNKRMNIGAPVKIMKRSLSARTSAWSRRAVMEGHDGRCL